MPKTNPEFDAFTKLVDRVLLVSHSEIKKRIEKHRKASLKNPNRRGPKRKSKPSASRVLDAYMRRHK